MVVVTMGDDDCIDYRNVGDINGAWRVSFRTHEAERTAPWLENGIEEDSEATWEFDIVTGVSQPCCS